MYDSRLLKNDKKWNVSRPWIKLYLSGLGKRDRGLGLLNPLYDFDPSQDIYLILYSKTYISILQYNINFTPQTINVDKFCWIKRLRFQTGTCTRGITQILSVLRHQLLWRQSFNTFSKLVDLIEIICRWNHNVMALTKQKIDIIMQMKRCTKKCIPKIDIRKIILRMTYITFFREFMQYFIKNWWKIKNWRKNTM